MDTLLALLETVIATASFPEHRVLAGDVGAIVEVFTQADMAMTSSSSARMARLAPC